MKKIIIILLEILVMIVVCMCYKNMLVGILWIVLHEFAHILMCKKYKIKIYAIKLYITGTKADIYGIDDITDKQKLLIYIVGPLFNIVMAIILYIVSRYLQDTYIIESIYINIGIAICNLIPAYPLDGSKIYEVLLNKKYLYKKSKSILISISYGISIMLLILFLITIYIHNLNISLLFASILIFYSTLLEKRNVMYLLISNIFSKKRRFKKREYIENRNISIYYKTSLVKALSLLDKNRFNFFYVLDENLRVISIVYENELIEILGTYGNITFYEYFQKKNLLIKTE